MWKIASRAGGVNIPNAFWIDHMKRFAEFLRESRLDEELDKAPKEIYSIDLAKGRLLFEGMEDGSAPEFEVPDGADPFEAIADAAWEEAFGESITEEEGDGKKETGGVKPGWGGEEYVSLDFPSLSSESPELLSEKEDSATLKGLLKSKEDYAKDAKSGKFWSDIARDNIQKYFVVSSDTESGPEWTLGYRDISEPDGEVKPVTPEQAEAIIDQKKTENKYSSGTKIYNIAPDGTVLLGKVPPKDSEDPEIEYVPLGKKFRTKFLRELNDRVSSRGRHFRWIGDTGRLEANTTSWITGLKPGDDRHGKLDDPRDKDRFSNAAYAPICDPDPNDPNFDTPEKRDRWRREMSNMVLSTVNTAAENKKKSGKKKDSHWANLAYKDNRFYLGDELLDKEGLT